MKRAGLQSKSMHETWYENFSSCHSLRRSVVVAHVQSSALRDDDFEAAGNGRQTCNMRLIASADVEILLSCGVWANCGPTRLRRCGASCCGSGTSVMNTDTSSAEWARRKFRIARMTHIADDVLPRNENGSGDSSVLPLAHTAGPLPQRYSKNRRAGRESSGTLAADSICNASEPARISSRWSLTEKALSTFKCRQCT